MRMTARLPVKYLVSDNYSSLNKNVDKRNKSGLLPQHNNLLHDIKPYDAPHSWIHLTEKYQRKLFGRYGSDSGVDSRICFNTKYLTAVENEKESLSEPFPLSEMIRSFSRKQVDAREEIKKREEDILKKLKNLDQWKNELRAKIAKREADSLAARKRKEEMIEEVRRHFGFMVDPREDRFKELLALKEREDKKKQKTERQRKAKAKEDEINLQNTSIKS